MGKFFGFCSSDMRPTPHKRSVADSTSAGEFELRDNVAHSRVKDQSADSADEGEMDSFISGGDDDGKGHQADDGLGVRMISGHAPVLPLGTDEACVSSATLSASFNLINLTIGACALTMPYCFKMCGIVGGAFLLIIVAALSYYSLMMLLWTAHDVNKYELTQMARFVLGEQGAAFAGICIVFMQLSSLIAYTNILGDALMALLTSASSRS